MNPYEKAIIDDSIAYARARMKKFHSSHGWDHVERVIKLSEIILKTEKDADPFITKTAAILHDIAREDENNSSGDLCHADLGSSQSLEFLLKRGLDDERAGHISRCIHSHRYRDDTPPASIEAKILYDADKLDSIGAVGIGRAFLFSGEIGARLHNAHIDIMKARSYSSEDSAYREYIFKLRFIKDKMFTAEGKKIAMERHEFMMIFFERLNNEFDGTM